MSDEFIKLKAPLLLSYPCPVKWESMEGDKLVRNCNQCQCQVQNISDYSEAQVTDLLLRVDTGEQICVAFTAPKVRAQSQVISFPFKRLSIALAASISLAYLVPNTSLIAYSRETAGVGSQTIASAPNLNPRIYTESKFGRMTDGVALSGVEHGIIDGRPAPSAIRDYVNDIIYYRGAKGNAETQRLFASFKNEVELGRISVPKLEDLGRAYELYGPVEQAANCYSLLSALADQGHPRKDSTQDWFPRRKPKEVTQEIQAFDQACSSGEYIRALWHLAAANGLRQLDPAQRAILPWSEIARRVDLLLTTFRCDNDPAVLAQALILARDEKDTPELRLWVDAKRNLAVRLFKENITKADEAISLRHYDEGFELMDSAVSAGSIDAETIKRCNWTSASKRLLTLAPHVGAWNKDDCLALAEQASSESKQPKQAYAHRVSHIDLPPEEQHGLSSGRGRSGIIKKSPVLPEGMPIPDNY